MKNEKKKCLIQLFDPNHVALFFDWSKKMNIEIYDFLLIRFNFIFNHKFMLLVKMIPLNLRGQYLCHELEVCKTKQLEFKTSISNFYIAITNKMLQFYI